MPFSDGAFSFLKTLSEPYLRDLALVLELAPMLIKLSSIEASCDSFKLTLGEKF